MIYSHFMDKQIPVLCLCFTNVLSIIQYAVVCDIMITATHIYAIVVKVRKYRIILCIFMYIISVVMHIETGYQGESSERKCRNEKFSYDKFPFQKILLIHSILTKIQIIYWQDHQLNFHFLLRCQRKFCWNFWNLFSSYLGLGPFISKIQTK